jgi:hypothetical protein
MIKADAEYVQACLPRPALSDFRHLNVKQKKTLSVHQNKIKLDKS